MSGYRCAAALDALLREINARAPHRDRTADGWIGDPAHASRGAATDHNPWVRLGSTGIVTARDFDHDPAHDADMGKIAEEIRRRRDARVKYLIFRRRICRSYPKGDLAAWEWGPYTGLNAHAGHLHVSVKPTRGHYDDTRRWLGSPTAVKVKPAPHPAPKPATRRPAATRTLHEGMTGDDVRFVQRFVGGVTADGVFGPATERAVRGYQRMRGITADGVVGPLTWRHIQGKAGP